MRILIAAASNSIRLYISTLLRKWGHEPLEASDGESARAACLDETPPTLAILDRDLPGTDGATLCAALAERAGPFLYRILLAPPVEGEDLAEGLEPGVHDYLFKPVTREQLRIRLAVAERELAADRLRRSLPRAAEAEDRAHLFAMDRLAQLGTLAAGITHEIKNPLAFVSLNVQLLRDHFAAVRPVLERAIDADGPEAEALVKAVAEMPELFQVVGDGLKRISRLVLSLRSFVGREDEEAGPVDLSACVENALTLCGGRVRQSLETTVEIAPDLPTVTGYGQRLEQVLINLFVNAADALEGRKDPGRLEIRAACEGEAVVLTVRDDGPGVPTELLETIWQPFFTTKDREKGTGLGLHISRQIIADHEGTLTVSNHPDGGCLFRLELPLHSSRVGAEAGLRG